LSQSNLTRRQFGQRMAALAGVPLAAPLADVQAEEPNAPKPTKPKAMLEAAVALTEVAKARYGKHISPEQLQAIQRDLENNGIPTTAALAKMSVRNSDGPAFLFQVDPG